MAKWLSNDDIVELSQAVSDVAPMIEWDAPITLCADVKVALAELLELREEVNFLRGFVSTDVLVARREIAAA